MSWNHVQTLGLSKVVDALCFSGRGLLIFTDGEVLRLDPERQGSPKAVFTRSNGWDGWRDGRSSSDARNVGTIAQFDGKSTVAIVDENDKLLTVEEEFCAVTDVTWVGDLFFVSGESWSRSGERQGTIRGYRIGKRAELQWEDQHPHFKPLALAGRADEGAWIVCAIGIDGRVFIRRSVKNVSSYQWTSLGENPNGIPARIEIVCTPCGDHILVAWSLGGECRLYELGNHLGSKLNELHNYGWESIRPTAVSSDGDLVVVIHDGNICCVRIGDDRRVDMHSIVAPTMVDRSYAVTAAIHPLGMYVAIHVDRSVLLFQHQDARSIPKGELRRMELRDGSPDLDIGENLAGTVLTVDVQRRLVKTLLRIQAMESVEGRRALLMGIPWSTSLDRSSGNSRTDITLIVEQLAALGWLHTGVPALRVLIENAIGYAEGGDVADTLREIAVALPTKKVTT